MKGFPEAELGLTVVAGRAARSSCTPQFPTPAAAIGPDHRAYREALVGTAGVAFVLFGSRWGSHIGFGIVFMTDVLLALGIAHLLATRVRHRGAPPVDPAFGRPHPLLVACVAWALVRFALGNRFDVDALRDVVPYLYAGLGVLAALGLRRSTPARRERTARILIVALGAHAAWCFLATVAPGVRQHLPMIDASLGLRVFALRWDFDTPIVGIFAAWLLVRLLRGGRRPVLMATGLCGCLFTIVATGSRAGLLGAFCVLLVGVLAGLRARTVPDQRKRAALAVLPLAMAAVAIVLPQTPIGDRLAGTFGGSDTSKSSANARGTTAAREKTWSYLLDHSQADLQRHLFGVGYGPNFLARTGSANLLVGSNDGSADEPRSPHNYWIGTLMRGGLVGVGLVGGLTLLVVARVAAQLGRAGDDDLLLIACAVPVALLIPATFGVVLESPFGAVPFFWACGVLLAWPRPLRPPGGRSRAGTWTTCAPGPTVYHGGHRCPM